MPLHLKAFLHSFQERLLLTHAIFSSCSFILETHFGKIWRQSVAMATIYGVRSSMWSRPFVIIKCFIVSYFTTLAKNICNCHIFLINLNF